jgi:hypothetical protein
VSEGEGASKLLCLRWDEKAAAMAEFSERSEERRSPQAAACEKFSSGNLFVDESHIGHLREKVNNLEVASLRSVANLYSFLAEKEMHLSIRAKEIF